MTAVATILIRSVGEKFACAADLVVGGKIVATTRNFPHGMRNSAYEAAERLALDRGLKVVALDD